MRSEGPLDSRKDRRNGFDFDGTLYDGDCTLDFYRFALKQHPRCLVALPAQIIGAALFGLRLLSRDRFKERFYSFLGFLPDIEPLVASFWDAHAKKLKPEVVERASKGDVVVSASPEFLLEPLCAKFGLELVASQVDPRTGKLLGPNCRGSAKVQRLQESGYDPVFSEFYTDSSADLPLVRLAQRSYLVTKQGICEYPGQSRP